MFGSKRSDDEKVLARRVRDMRVAVSSLGVAAGLAVTRDFKFKAVDQGEVPIVGAQVTIERGAEAKRVTASRAALMGPFALLAKKDSTQLFVRIDGVDGSACLIGVSASKEMAARKFAMTVHQITE